MTACLTRQANEKTIETPKDVTTSATPYDTVGLKGGYQLIYSTTDEKRNLRLKGQNTDTLIWTMEIDELEKFMGWLEADFKDQFVLYSSGGNGVYNMNLIDKRTAREIIKGIGIKNDTIKNVIYYQDNELNNDNLTLFDLGTMKKETYPPPTDIQCIQWWHCIDNIELTDNELILEYFNTPDTKTVKKYSR